MSSPMIDFATAFAGLAKAKDAAIALAAATDVATRQQHQTEILAQIAESYSAILDAKSEYAGLVDRIKELESIEATKARYKLVSLGAAHVNAFAPRQPSPDEAPHYLCANCLSSGTISHLNQTSHGPYTLAWHCNRCDEKLSVDTGRPRQTSANRVAGYY